MSEADKAFLADLSKLAATAPKRGDTPVTPVEPVEASADQSAALANAGADALETVG